MNSATEYVAIAESWIEAADHELNRDAASFPGDYYSTENRRARADVCLKKAHVYAMLAVAVRSGP